MKKPQKQSFLYGSTILLGSMIIVKIIGVVFHIPLLNIIGLTGNGIFSSSYTVYTTVYALTVTGLSSAVARMVAAKATLDFYRDVRKLFRISTIIFLILGILGSVILFLSARGFSILINNPNTTWAVMAIAPAIFFCCLMASYRGYYEGLQNMTPTAIVQVVEVVTKLIAGLGGAALVMGAAEKQFLATGYIFGIQCDSREAMQIIAAPFGAAGAMLGVSVSTLIGFCYIFLRYRIKGDGITKEMLMQSPAATPGKVLAKALLRFALPLTLGAVVIQLSALVDTFTIQNQLSRCAETNPVFMQGAFGQWLKEGEQIHTLLYGVFSACITLFNVVPAFTNILGKSALPNVTASWIAKDRGKLQNNVEAIVRITMLLAAPMALGIACMSKPILNLLYGANEPATALLGGELLSLLMIGALFLSLVSPLNAILQGIGRADLPVKFLCVGVVIKLILNIVLIGIPQVNIMGSAISTISCYLLISILSLRAVQKHCGIRFNYCDTILKPIISGFFCGFSAKSCYFLLTKAVNNSIITFVSIGVGAVSYCVIIFVLHIVVREDILMLPQGKKIAGVLEKLHIL